jgi:DNA-directed RNA polymerase specialized sigma24 family protein
MTQAKVERSYNKYSYLSVSHTSTVDPHYDLLELSEELVKGMRHIEYSDILYDKFFNHLSNKEIAEKHGCCSETIRVQVKKGIENLRENMKQCV